MKKNINIEVLFHDLEVLDFFFVCFPSPRRIPPFLPFTDILIIELLFLALFFIGGYEYVVFRCDSTGFGLYSDYNWIMNTMYFKICDYNYFTIISLINLRLRLRQQLQCICNL